MSDFDNITLQYPNLIIRLAEFLWEHKNEILEKQKSAMDKIPFYETRDTFGDKPQNYIPQDLYRKLVKWAMKREIDIFERIDKLLTYRVYYHYDGEPLDITKDMIIKHIMKECGEIK